MYTAIIYGGMVCINADAGAFFFREIFRKININNIKTLDEQYKQCKRIANTLFLVRKIKKLKI